MKKLKYYLRPGENPEHIKIMYFDVDNDSADAINSELVGKDGEILEIKIKHDGTVKYAVLLIDRGGGRGAIDKPIFFDFQYDIKITGKRIFHNRQEDTIWEAPSGHRWEISNIGCPIKIDEYNHGNNFKKGSIKKIGVLKWPIEVKLMEPEGLSLNN